MNQFLSNLLLAGLLAPVALYSSAQETPATDTSTDVVISSGLEGGGYWNLGNKLQGAAGSHGLSAENLTSTGSISNLKVLVDEDSPVNVAFSQADALQYFLNGKPEAAGAIDTLKSIGEECVFVITGKDSDIKDDEDMQEAERLQLGIKSPNSGIRVTFDHMASLVPELKNATVHYGDTVELINDLVHPLSNIEKAVMVVQDPAAHSPEIDMVISNPDKYRFVKISDPRFSQSANGDAAYRSAKVAPSAVPGAGKLETICVNGLLLANTNKLSAAQRSSLNALVASQTAD